MRFHGIAVRQHHPFAYAERDKDAIDGRINNNYSDGSKP